MTGITDEKLKMLDTLIRDNDRIVIVSHTHPDGDALGSGCAMLSYLKDKRQKENCCFIVPNSYASNLEFIPGDKLIAEDRQAEAVKMLEEADLIFIQDLNKLSRTDALENNIRAAKGTKVLIDHHLNPDCDDFSLVFSKTEISSTCEFLYYILCGLPNIGGNASELPADCRTALMTGMTTDTNNFANSVFPSTLRMASELLEAGTDRDSIIGKLYFQYKESRVRIFAHLLGEKMKILEGGFAYMILNRKTAGRFGIEEGDTEGLVNIPLSIGQVRVSALLKEDEGYFRVSLRSKRGIRLTEFAGEYFHGGGHAQASGGRLFFPEDIKNPSEAAAYLEKAAARFMKTLPPGKQNDL